MTPPSPKLIAWHDLAEEVRAAVRSLHIDAQQLEYAGTIDKAIRACEEAPPGAVAGLAIVDEAQPIGFVLLSRGESCPAWASPGSVAITALRIAAALQGQGLGRHSPEPGRIGLVRYLSKAVPHSSHAPARSHQPASSA